MNIIFDFGNVLVRWEPERTFMPCFDYDETKYWYFWRHVCDAEFRDRIDAGESQWEVIHQKQAQYPEYSDVIAMYFTHWDESLPGEVPGMYELVSQLKSDPANHIYGLTNWSMETFPQARAKFPVLQLIDNYVVSGALGMVKPDPRIFHILLDKYSLRAEDCIFIDDNPANVEGANRVGLHGILFQGADALRETLKVSSIPV